MNAFEQNFLAKPAQIDFVYGRADSRDTEKTDNRKAQ